jgi:lipopolysaccharide export system permease protein
LNSDSNPLAVAGKGRPRAQTAAAAGQARWLRWTLLDRYLLAELVGPFLFGVAAFASILIAGQFLFKLTSFLAKGAPVPEVMALFGLKLVPMIVLTFPMAALLATLLGYGRLSGDAEITAMAASGIPFIRIAAPAFLLGLVVSVGALAINEGVVPRAGRTSRVLEAAIAKALQEKGLDAAFVEPGRAAVIQDFENKKLARLVVAQGFDLREKTLRGVTMLEFDQDGLGARWIQADSAVWEKDRRWLFRNARVQPWRGARAPVGGSPENARMRMAAAELEFTINKTPNQVLSSQKKPEDMSYAELAGYLEALRDQSVEPQAMREMEVDLHNKIAIPFASLIFTLIGAPLALRRPRSGSSVGLGLSVLIIFGYYILWHGMSIMAEGGHVAPLVASWTANAVGLLAGGALIARAAS